MRVPGRSEDPVCERSSPKELAVCSSQLRASRLCVACSKWLLLVLLLTTVIAGLGALARGPLIRLSARTGCTACVAVLSALGTDVDSADVDGWTALHLASQRGHQSTVRLLLRLGTRADAQTFHGDTPLHKGCVYGHGDIAELLLDAGAEVDDPDDGGKTPLHFASEARLADTTEVVKLLIARGHRRDEAASLRGGRAS